MIRWSICFIPASVTALTIRSASRRPGLPVSISTVSPAGVTSNVAAPPSTSIQYKSSRLSAGAADAAEARVKTTAAASRTRAGMVMSKVSMSENKLFGIQQRPGQILKSTEAIVAGRRDQRLACGQLVERWRSAERGPVQFRDNVLGRPPGPGQRIESVVLLRKQL